MEFKKITKEQIQSSLDYIVATIILNKYDEFNLEEIVADVKEGLDKNDDEIVFCIQRKLKMMMNNGLIVKHGSYYSNTNRFYQFNTELEKILSRASYVDMSLYELDNKKN